MLTKLGELFQNKSSPPEIHDLFFNFYKFHKDEISLYTNHDKLKDYLEAHKDDESFDTEQRNEILCFITKWRREYSDKILSAKVDDSVTRAKSEYGELIKAVNVILDCGKIYKASKAKSSIEQSASKFSGLYFFKINI